jgi:hypothetical protein
MPKSINVNAARVSRRVNKWGAMGRQADKRSEKGSNAAKRMQSKMRSQCRKVCNHVKWYAYCGTK